MKTVKKWLMYVCLIAAVSVTAVGCGNTSNDNAADEVKTTADDKKNNLGDDIEEGVDDVGDAIDEGVDDVEEGAEDLTNDREGTDRTTTENDHTNMGTEKK